MSHAPLFKDCKPRHCAGRFAMLLALVTLTGSLASANAGGDTGGQPDPPRTPTLKKEQGIELAGHDKAVTGLTFSPDGQSLLSIDESGKVLIWAVATRNRRAWKTPAAAAAFSPDSKSVALAEDEMVSLRDVATGGEQARFKGGAAKVASVAFSSNGKRLASGADDGTIRVWDVAAGTEVRAWTGHKGRVTALAFSPDDRQLASGGAHRGQFRVGGVQIGSGTAENTQLWDVATGKPLQSGGRGCTLAYAASGRVVVAGGLVHGFHEKGGIRAAGAPEAFGGFGGISVCSAASGDSFFELVGQGEIVAVSGDGRLLATGGCAWHHLKGLGIVASAQADDRVRLWELATMRELVRLPGYSATALAFAPASGKLALGTASGQIHLHHHLDGFPAAAARDPVATLWQKLGSADPAVGHQALADLLRAGDDGIAFLDGQLPPARVANNVEALIAQLDDEDFAVREAAELKLQDLGRSAEAALRQALAKATALESRRRLERLTNRLQDCRLTGEPLRQARAVQLLEQFASPKAEQVLQKLSKGAAEAELTREARAALERLQRRPRGR